jgi:alkanesulfonate monooxygenase
MIRVQLRSQQRGVGEASGISIGVFSTCPQSKDVPQAEYVRRVEAVARWSEDEGCTGVLVFTDNGLLDPWLVSHAILRETSTLCPLVAVQPAYMHPYAAAKMVSSFAYLYGRRIFVNMVAGGFRNDLLALADETPHDERYDRLVEYVHVMMGLLSSDRPITFEGRFYRVKNLRLTPPMPPPLLPGLMVSGSSAAGREAARAMGAIAVKYPRPPEEEQETADLIGRSGVRVGIIARSSADEAWQVARERFPEDRKGQITHQLAVKVSDSRWHHQLSTRRPEEGGDGDPYWLGPFQNYRTFCPYLVGSYARVAEEVAGYLRAGFTTFITDIPPSREELEHTNEVFARATAPTAPTVA